MFSPESFSLQVSVQSLIKLRDYFHVTGSSLTQTRVRVGTCSIFLIVPVLCPLLTTSRVIHSLPLNPALPFLNRSTDMSYISLILKSSPNLVTIFIIFFTGLIGFLFSTALSFFYSSF